MLIITDCIAGSGKLETYCRGNIAGIYSVQLCSLVCMHLKDTSHTLLFILGSIQYIGTGFHGTGVNTEESQLSYERIGHDLKCQC